MSLAKVNKDHSSERSDLDRIIIAPAPKSVDILRFWTTHPTDKILVDLHPFANGQDSSVNSAWGGAFTGRRELITQLAPAIQARLTLSRPGSAVACLLALRKWWRLFDDLEAGPSPNKKMLAPVLSLANLNSLHEAAAHQSNMSYENFGFFVGIANDARKLQIPRQPDLMWETPRRKNTIRTLIPDEQARAVKTGLKQDWERLRKKWKLNDALLLRAEQQLTPPAGLPAQQFTPGSMAESWEVDERLLKNVEHLARIRLKAGKVLPTSEELLAGRTRVQLSWQGLSLRVMRAIIFPTVEEMDIAFSLALMHSGWNPGTLLNLDGSVPSLVSDHPKNASQLVLSIADDNNGEVTMQADKPRAGGRTQFCVGLKKNPSSPPVIVATYAQRVTHLRIRLRADLRFAISELTRLQEADCDKNQIDRQFRLVQRLEKGCRSVWLYVDSHGQINWAHGNFNRYEQVDSPPVTYVHLLIRRLNQERAYQGKSLIPPVTMSDFRDIYARWVYVQSGGNILAVMLALGHASLESSLRYVDNNIINAEIDEQCRNFLGHLFGELSQGRVDITILTQLVRHGPLTPELQERLDRYRRLMRSRVGAVCKDPHRPPLHIAPLHQAGTLCGPQRCTHRCPQARFLPESVDGMAMREQELHFMSDELPRETWLQGGFQAELDEVEYLLKTCFPSEKVAAAQETWRTQIAQGDHHVPGLGIVSNPSKDDS